MTQLEKFEKAASKMTKTKSSLQFQAAKGERVLHAQQVADTTIAGLVVQDQLMLLEIFQNKTPGPLTNSLN